MSRSEVERSWHAPGSAIHRALHHPRTWLVALLVALGVVAIGTAFDLSRSRRTPAPPVLVLAPVTRGLVLAEVHAPGVVVPARQTDVRAALAGRLATVEVAAGDRVRRGQVLARLEEVELRAQATRAEANLVAAEAAAFEAEVVRSAVSRGLDEGAAPGELGPELDTLDDARAIAEARVASAVAEIAAREAELQAARARARLGVLRAPYDGVVTATHAEVGQVLEAGARIVTVNGEPERVAVAASVDERALGALAPGQTARLAVPAAPGLDVEGRVLRIGSPVVADRGAGASTSYPVVIDVGEHDGKLRPGMNVTAQVRTASRPHALRVPLEALSFEPRGHASSADDGAAVWAQGTAGEPLRRIPVKVGVRDDKMVEVSSPELREGQGVAVSYARAR